MRVSDEYLHGHGAMHGMSSATRGFHGLALMHLFVVQLLSLLASFKRRLGVRIDSKTMQDAHVT